MPLHTQILSTYGFPQTTYGFIYFIFVEFTFQDEPKNCLLRHLLTTHQSD